MVGEGGVAHAVGVANLREVNRKSLGFDGVTCDDRQTDGWLVGGDDCVRSGGGLDDFRVTGVVGVADDKTQVFTQLRVGDGILDIGGSVDANPTGFIGCVARDRDLPLIVDLQGDAIRIRETGDAGGEDIANFRRGGNRRNGNGDIAELSDDRAVGGKVTKGGHYSSLSHCSIKSSARVVQSSLSCN